MILGVCLWFSVLCLLCLFYFDVLVWLFLFWLFVYGWVFGCVTLCVLVYIACLDCSFGGWLVRVCVLYFALVFPVASGWFALGWFW